jgi:hypothetical protein
MDDLVEDSIDTIAGPNNKKAKNSKILLIKFIEII